MPTPVLHDRWRMKADDVKSQEETSEGIAQIRRGVEREFEFLRVQQPRFFHLAVNEAEALAWLSGVPQLVLPELAAEKIRQLAAWQRRQKHLKQNTSSPLSFEYEWTRTGINN